MTMLWLQVPVALGLAFAVACWVRRRAVPGKKTRPRADRRESRDGTTTSGDAAAGLPWQPQDADAVSGSSRDSEGFEPGGGSFGGGGASASWADGTSGDSGSSGGDSGGGGGGGGD